MVDYEFTAKVIGKVGAEDAEAARAMLAKLFLLFGHKVHVFVKPEGETYKDLYDGIYKQTGYGKWYDRKPGDPIAGAISIDMHVHLTLDKED